MMVRAWMRQVVIGALALAAPAVGAQQRGWTPRPLPTGPLPDDGKTSATITEVPITRIDPPEDEFFSKRLDYRGIPIKGHADVDDAAFYEAWRRIDRILRHNPAILRNLLRAGSEVHIIGRNQGQTDLPDWRWSKGVPLNGNPNQTQDERSRGMGGRNCSCGEENLLRLPNDRYRGRDILSHEFTHTVHAYGLSENIRQLITQTYQNAMAKGLWHTPQGRPIYAGSNENEYFAEMVLWYLGGRGDWPASMGVPVQPGPEFLKQYDPDGYKLIDDYFNGRWDVGEWTPRARGGGRGEGATSPTQRRGRRGGAE